MYQKIAWFSSLLFLFCHTAFSQGYELSGTVLDETDNSALIGVSVTVFPLNDTAQKTGSVTDVDGSFVIPALPSGQYRIRLTYVGFRNDERSVSITGNTDLGTMKMKVLSTQLQNVVVQGQQVQAQQSGDTTSFNAGAYKTNPDATAEDLMNKMPGISTEGGTVKAQGEDVKKILVDGKPFFGDDPNAAIKNLPAEIIDRIQVFDKLSDQAQLTGFDDGNSQKTINIITKAGRNNGQFGKLFAGYGTRDEHFGDNYYLAGGNVNFFKGDTRVSIIALSNNVNQQNFSTEDLLGVVGSSSGQGRGGPQGGGRSGGGSFRGGGSRGSDGGGSRGGGGDAGNFLVGQQGGITTTHSAGVNYSDKWGKKLKVSGSYFFNYTDNENVSSLTRTYFISADSSQVYKENSGAATKNTNHRASLRMEYTIDSLNSLIFTPRLSFQNNEYERTLNGNTRLQDSSLLSTLLSRNSAKNTGYNFSGDLLYQHRFAKRGRTISLNIGGLVNNRMGDGTMYSEEHYFADSASYLQDQRYDLGSSGQTWNGEIRFTEPLTDRSQVMLNYSPSVSRNTSDKETFDRNNATNGYDLLNDTLSNKYDNTYTTQRGGLSYRNNTQQSNFMAGVNVQQAKLQGVQDFPYHFELEKTFTSVLPMLMYNYRFSRTQNLRIMYRTSTTAPSISQLQQVPDISNPLLVKTGNPDLQQDYQHTLIFRYGSTNTATSRSFFAMLFGNYTIDYIGNQTILPSKDTVIQGVTIKPGSQITLPVNLDGYWSVRSFFTYGMPIRPIKTNLNLNAGLNYSRLPGLIDSTLNYANNFTMNGGVVLSSNISENLDFTLAYSGYYNIVRNTIRSESDNNYYNQNTSLRLNWILQQRLVLNTSLNHTLYSGLSQGYNQSYLLWNASIGYKFLKDRSLDLRLTAYDMLNQNKAIERTVTETYIEDSYTNVLQRYFMLNLTYTLRRFGVAKVEDNTDAEPGNTHERRGEGRGPR